MRRFWLILLALLAAAVTIDGQMPRVLESRLKFTSSADVTAPAVTIGTPASDPHDNLTDATLDISGTATDAVGVSACFGDVNTTGSFSVTGTTSWSATNVSLIEGANLVSVWCTDAAGNGSISTADTVSVTHDDGVSGAGCGASCLFETSFTVAQGWEADKTQLSGSSNEFDCTGTTSTDLDGEQSGVGKAGDWDTEEDNCAGVLTAANRAAGDGGRGFRQWMGTGGSNINSGGIKYQFTESSEIWVRAFARFESGFKWGDAGHPGAEPHYVKFFDFNNDGGALVRIIFGWGQPSGQPFGAYDVTNARNYIGSLTWVDVMGAETSDGNWHCYEQHLKADTNGSNGVVEAWVDGVSTYTTSTANLGMSTWRQLNIPTNQAYPDNASDMALDVDDIKISVFQRIEC